MRKMSVLFFAAFVAAFAFGGEAEAVKEKVAKFWDMMPYDPADASWKGDRELEPGVAAPKDDPSLWGKWIFWNGQWWANHFLQPESQGVSHQLPAAGLKKGWNQYHDFWMKAKMDVPADWKGRRLVYEQEGMNNLDVTLYVNGKKAGLLKRPAARIEVTKFVKTGASNEFLMRINGSGNMKFQQHPPFLHATPPVCIEDVFANTSWREKKLTVEVEVTVPKDVTAELKSDVVDADGKCVKTVKGRLALKAGTSTGSASTAWADPITWELGRGYMYTLKTSLKIDGKVYSYRDVPFGFREIWREERKIFMNGHEQKYRVTYNFGCNRFGAKFLQGIGYNCIQYAHQTAADPQMDAETMEYLSRNGIACIIPTTAFDWNTKNNYMNPGEKRDSFMAQQAKNLKRHRNWPCVAMVYMGVNCYLPQWAYEAVHLGSGDGSPFAKMMDALVAEAKKTNPNVLYFSHSDGNTGEIASANLYLNWVPMQEREEWPSRWAERGHFPFQACEFGHPYQYSWYKDDAAYISEYLAIYYGEEAYAQEPECIRVRQKPQVYIRRILHPLFWTFTDEFVWRVHRAWRTFGINAGIVWFNLDYGFGMPGWKYPNVWNQYGPNYGFFKSESEVPDGKPEWAFPSWEIYRHGNEDFLGWIAGSGRITDRTHAYNPGGRVEKRIVSLWDRFDPKKVSVKWQAKLDGERIAAGSFDAKLVSNVPTLTDIAFDVPEPKGEGKGLIRAAWFDTKGEVVAKDEFPFEVLPKVSANWKKTPTFALYDPSGKTAAELQSFGLTNFKTVSSLADVKDATHLVVGSFALGKDDGFAALPMSAVASGLKVLVLPQGAGAWQKFGFDVQDRVSRVLFVRDTTSMVWSRVGDAALRDWAGAPPTEQKNAYGLQQYGSLVGHPKHEPRWAYNMGVAALQLRSPTAAGYIPQVEGEFDMDYSALLQYRYGKGSIQFCTLDFFGRVDTGSDDKAVAKPAFDAAARKVAAATFVDFLTTPVTEECRSVVADGQAAVRIAGDLGVRTGSARGKESVVLVGRDSKMKWSDVTAAARGGANVLVVDNAALFKVAGFELKQVTALDKCYGADFDRADPAFRGIGRAQFHWRDRFQGVKFAAAPKGFTIGAEGFFARGRIGAGEVWLLTVDPFSFEDRIATESSFYMNEGEKDVKQVDDKTRQVSRVRCQLTFVRARQLVSRLLTNLGATSEPSAVKYTGLVKPFDPYFYTYW